MIIFKLFRSKRSASPELVSADIHAALEETIAERRKIVTRWERSWQFVQSDADKDVHEQLADTIARYKKEKQAWEQRLFGGGKAESIAMINRRVA